MRRIKRRCECGCGSIANLGRRYINGHQNRNMSAEQRSKIGEAQKGNTSGKVNKGRKFSKVTLIKMSAAQKGKKLSKEHVLKRTIAQMKCRTDGYCDAWSDREYKEDLREERCGNCNMNEEESLVSYSQRLHLHHKDGDKSNCHPDNFDTLCVSCHAIADWQIRKEYNNGSA